MLGSELSAPVACARCKKHKLLQLQLGTRACCGPEHLGSAARVEAQFFYSVFPDQSEPKSGRLYMDSSPTCISMTSTSSSHILMTLQAERFHQPIGEGIISYIIKGFSKAELF